MPPLNDELVGSQAMSPAVMSVTPAPALNGTTGPTAADVATPGGATAPVAVTVTLIVALTSSEISR